MTALGSSVLLTTGRSQRSSGGQTGPAVPYLIDEPAHVRRIPIKEYETLPESALGSEYEARVESGVDVRAGDRILTIVLAADGVTPWPDAGMWGDPERAAGSVRAHWVVALATEREPGPRPYRLVYIKRRDTGGVQSG